MFTPCEYNKFNLFLALEKMYYFPRNVYPRWLNFTIPSNLYSREVVDLGSETQMQVSENLN